MSHYTTEVRYICETSAGLDESEGYNSIGEIIEAAAPNVFNFDFPIFDEEYRLPLEIKILRHFYTREISEETVGLWKLRLEDKLNILMPYFNQLYKSELLKFNPLWDVDLHTDHQGGEAGEHEEKLKGNNTNVSNRTGTNIMGGDKTTSNDNTSIGNKVTDSNNNGSEIFTRNNEEKAIVGEQTVEHNKNTINTQNSANNNDWQLFSDTPQGGIQGIDPGSSANDSRYLTTATHNINNDSNISNENNVADNKGSLSRSEVNTNKDTSDRRSNIDEKKTEGTSEHNVSKETSSINQNTTTNDSENSMNTHNQDNLTKFNNTNQYVEHIFGKRGYTSYAKLLMEFRDSFINIDEMLIKSLEPLFFSLW